MIFTQPKKKKHKFFFQKPGGRIHKVAFDMDWEEEERSAKNHLVENSDERAGGVGFRQQVNCVSADGVRDAREVRESERSPYM